MVEEKEYLVSKLKEAGVKSKVYTSMKMLKTANEPHLGAVLVTADTVSRSGSKKIWTDQEGQQKRRYKLWNRNTIIRVVIADTSDEKVEKILSNFLLGIGKGLEVDGNWVNIVVDEIDWVEEGDSILKAKVAVQFDVKFEGGIYRDTKMIPMNVGDIS